MLITTKTKPEVIDMAQLNFTLEYDFLVGLFKNSKEDVFAKLMEGNLLHLALVFDVCQHRLLSAD